MYLVHENMFLSSYNENETKVIWSFSGTESILGWVVVQFWFWFLPPKKKSALKKPVLILFCLVDFYVVNRKGIYKKFKAT